MKAAVAQVKLYNNIEANLITISKYISRASKEDIDLLCFPECNITGYVCDFSKVDQKKLMETVDIIQEQVTKAGVNVIVGAPYFEREKCFNSAIVLLTNGERYIYHKINLTSSEEAYFKKGKEPLIFQLGEVKFGVLICRDQNDSILAKRYKTLGADAIFILSAHFYEPIEAIRKLNKNRALPIARAVENNLFVLKANAVGSINEFISLGGSLIINPEGFVVREGDNVNEMVLSYEISRREKKPRDFTRLTQENMPDTGYRFNLHLCILHLHNSS
ncbi:MAG: carbon-nitrogen hydrolase family protein [Euryarchaeota archaeon]|nr:carbon-nitrogen hydrolase family protein [Euryarchaeota archaeon]